MLFSTKLFWFEDDQFPATTTRTSEQIAREWAAKRSTEVRGYCEVLYGGSSIIGRYRDGVDVLVAEVPVKESSL